MPWLTKYRKTSQESQQEQRLAHYYQWVHENKNRKKRSGDENDAAPNLKFILAVNKAKNLYKLNKKEGAKNETPNVMMDSMNHDEVEAVLINSDLGNASSTNNSSGSSKFER